VSGATLATESINSCGEDCEYNCQNPHVNIDNAYEIQNIDPAVDIFNISAEIPEDIQDSLEESFSLFWGHPSSAGNEIRKALEILMDEMKIKNKGTNKKGEEYPLNLHARIEEFGRIENGKYSGLAMKLLAIKWAGNAGSHEDALTREDVLDAYEVLEYVLEEIFVRPMYLSKIIKTRERLDKAFKPQKGTK
jgi:hypothetical protein